MIGGQLGFFRTWLQLAYKSNPREVEEIINIIACLLEAEAIVVEILTDFIVESQDSKYNFLVNNVNGRHYSLKVLNDMVVKIWKRIRWILVSKMDAGIYMVKFNFYY